MQNPLTPAQRQALKGRAHRLAPVVLIGAGGLTAAVSAEIERALAAHELIKIRVAGEDRAQRDALLAEICERSGSAPVQHIGKILVVYRERVEPPAMPIRPTVPDQPVRPPKRARPGQPARAQTRSRVRRPPRRTALQPPARGARAPRARRGKARPR